MFGVKLFYIYILLSGFLYRYAKVQVNINVTPQVKECSVWQMGNYSSN